EKSVSDILPRASFVKKVPEIVSSADREKIHVPKEKIVKHFKEKSEISPKKVHHESGSKKTKRPKLFIWLPVAAVITAVFFVMSQVLPRATIVLVFKKVPAYFDTKVLVSSAAKKVD